jgi:hypothetical protein
MRTYREAEAAGEHAARPRAVGVNSRAAVGRLVWLQRAVGNQVVSRVFGGGGPAAPAASRPGPGLPVVQRLTLVPFEKADEKLTGFAAREGTYVATAKPTGKVGKDEAILVIGHGNGVTLANYESPTTAGGKYVALQAKHLSDLLHGLLPDKYTGVITVWACQAARPWRHIPELRKDVTDPLDYRLDLTFISLLYQFLKVKPQQVRGPIGFITLDRAARDGKVYADETLKFLGKTVAAKDGGLVTANAPVDKSFYEEDSSESSDDDDFDVDAEEGGEDLEKEESGTRSDDDTVLTTESPGSDTGEMMIDDEEGMTPRQRKELALESIVRSTPFGESSRPPTLRERLNKLHSRK